MTIDAAEWRNEDTRALLEVILDLPDLPAAERFFRDLCTLRELHDMGQRWQIVRLLDEGLHYGEISRITGASTATVTRIAQWLNHGTGGYREALARSWQAPAEGPGAPPDDPPGTGSSDARERTGSSGRPARTSPGGAPTRTGGRS
jgi:TrpR-related protein YerC/YecD